MSPEHAPVRRGGPVVAVLTAAGSGARLGAGGPKALVHVGGQSLLRRAARGLLDSGVVDHLVVTAPAGEVERFAAELSELSELAGSARTSDATTGAAGAVGPDPAVRSPRVVAGSAASRQASVALGLAAALIDVPDAEVVLVHDAARALTPPQVVRRVVEAVRLGHDAVVPAVAVTDTIKEVEPDPGGRADRGEPVVGTPDRSRLRAVQTPQGFSADVLLRAHRAGAQRSGDEARAASDDAALVEAAGGRVVVVEGDPLALKVTTPLDLAVAELLAGSGPRPSPS